MTKARCRESLRLHGMPASRSVHVSHGVSLKKQIFLASRASYNIYIYLYTYSRFFLNILKDTYDPIIEFYILSHYFVAFGHKFLGCTILPLESLVPGPLMRVAASEVHRGMNHDEPLLKKSAGNDSEQVHVSKMFECLDHFGFSENLEARSIPCGNSSFRIAGLILMAALGHPKPDSSAEKGTKVMSKPGS